MSLPESYLDYPLRRYGNDHSWFDWRLLRRSSPVSWPHGKAVAVWVNVSLQHYPLDQKGIPFKVPNGMTMPYPDLRHYSLRDYGNRVGVFRVADALNKFEIPSTWAINAELAVQNPWLVGHISSLKEVEIAAHGWNMDSLLHNGMSRDEEAALVQRCRSTLEEVYQPRVTGWLSPARQQSWNTLELLSEAGFEYCMDWVNDDLAYCVLPHKGNLHMMPLNTEIEDQFVMCNNLHSEDSWAQQVIDAIDFMQEEASALNQGRMLGISLHPWLVGQPHRIACLERVLQYLRSQSGVWLSTAGQILGHWQVQNSQSR
ncbi:MAG: polysaccharide deacetylase [Betaproteobacteria bacterium]|nr:polysaccharide deacetylase [Betaproteobacteria bacterium]